MPLTARLRPLPCDIESAVGVASTPVRLWRARRRCHHIDAILSDVATGVELAFFRDDRALVTWTFHGREAAIADADRRVQELLLAGWNLHW